MERIKIAKGTSKVNKVTIYTTNTCHRCMKIKEFLKENNVKYEEINVQEDEKARNEMFEKSGQFGVPVIDVNGEVIVGFQMDILKKALGI